jgi:hypothetical protein
MPRLLTSLVALASVPALAAAGQPDLVVEHVVVTPDAVKARVSNRGGGDARSCQVDLRIFDSTTHRATGSRRRDVAALRAGASLEVAFPYEAVFAGQQLRLTVDSQNRVAETDERNNVSEVVAALAAPLPRKPPTREPGSASPTPAPVDAAQGSVDLVAEDVRVQDGAVRAVVRNVGNEDFTGRRTAVVSREAWGSAHLLERVEIARRRVPSLDQGEEMVIEAPRPALPKGARRYVYRLRLEPVDSNPDNDVASKTLESTPID